MRSIDSGIQAQLENNELIPFALFEMYIDSTYYRYTNCDVPLVVDGDRFESRQFTVPDVQYSQGAVLEEISIEMSHLDAGGQDQDEISTLTSVFVGGSPQNEVAVLSLVVLDPSDFTVVGDTGFIIFKGNIGAWSISEDTLNISVVGILDQWSQRTLSNHPPSCRWRVFKGTECGYAGGETVCDRSYARCLELSNEDNFGGFRWLPSIINKQFWWGKQMTRQEKEEKGYGRVYGRIWIPA